MARGMGALDDLIIGMTKLGDDGVAAAKPLANVNADTLQRVISTIAKNNPEIMIRAMDNMEPENITKILESMNVASRTKIYSKLADVDPTIADKIRKAGGQVDGTAGAATKVPKTADELAAEAATRKEFWSAVKQGSVIGAGAGLLMWIDKKFEESEEDFKDCMAACIPENWHEYDGGDLKKSDLKYSTLDSLDERGIEPIANQPYCTKKINDCGEYCGKSCKDETEVDLPGTNLLTGGAGFFGGLLNDTFGSFTQGLGFPEGSTPMISSGMSGCVFFMLIIMLMK